MNVFVYISINSCRDLFVFDYLKFKAFYVVKFDINIKNVSNYSGACRNEETLSWVTYVTGKQTFNIQATPTMELYIELNLFMIVVCNHGTKSKYSAVGCRAYQTMVDNVMQIKCSIL